MKKSIDTLTLTDFLRSLYYPICKELHTEAARQDKTVSKEFLESYESLKEFEEYSITPLEAVNYIERITRNLDSIKMSLLENSKDDFEEFEKTIFKEIEQLSLFPDSYIPEEKLIELKGYCYIELMGLLQKYYDELPSTDNVSEEIKPYLKKAQQAGYLDEYFRLIKENDSKKLYKFTRAQQRLFVMCCDFEIGSNFNHKSYKEELSRLWKVKNLSSYKFEGASLCRLIEVFEWFNEETKRVMTDFCPELEVLK